MGARLRPSLRHAQGAGRQVLGQGRDVLFDIDWQGAQQLFQQAGGDVVRVFILPPSLTELRTPAASTARPTAEE